MPVSFERRHSSFFAEVAGVDLQKPLSDEDWQAIYDGFKKHAILLFRNQPLSDEQHVTFSERFGPVITATDYHWRTEKRRVHLQMADISNIGDDGSILPADDERRMHTLANRLGIPTTRSSMSRRAVRCCWRERSRETAAIPSLPTCVPPTMPWPRKRRTRSKELVAEHNIVHSRKTMGYEGFTERAKNELPPVPQVLVRHNIETGRKALYIASHASHVVGWPQEKGRALLDELLAHATQPQFVYRHRWRAGDLILWDNRCTMHRATEYDDLNARRDLQRTTVSDEINSVERRDAERSNAA